MPRGSHTPLVPLSTYGHVGEQAPEDVVDQIDIQVGLFRAQIACACASQGIVVWIQPLGLQRRQRQVGSSTRCAPR